MVYLSGELTKPQLILRAWNLEGEKVLIPGMLGGSFDEALSEGAVA